MLDLIHEELNPLMCRTEQGGPFAHNSIVREDWFRLSRSKEHPVKDLNLKQNRGCLGNLTKLRWHQGVGVGPRFKIALHLIT